MPALFKTTFWTDSCSYSGHPITFLWSTSNWRLHDNYCHERKWGFIITTIVSKDWDVIVSTATAGVTWVRRKWRKFGRVTCDHYATLRHNSCPFHIRVLAAPQDSLHNFPQLLHVHPNPNASQLVRTYIDGINNGIHPVWISTGNGKT